jgi:hypothetical protein
MKKNLLFAFAIAAIALPLSMAFLRARNGTAGGLVTP